MFMKNVIAYVKGNATSILYMLASALLGLILLIWPMAATNLVFAIISAVCIIIGIVRLVQYFIWDDAKALNGYSMATGVFMVIAGILVYCARGVLVSLAPFVFGIILFVGGVMKLQGAFDLKRIGIGRWFMALLASMISILLGLIITLNPFAATMTLMRFVGVSLLVEAVQDAAYMVRYEKYKKNYFKNR